MIEKEMMIEKGMMMVMVMMIGVREVVMLMMTMTMLLMTRMMMEMMMVMILNAVSGAARKALLGGRGHQTKLHSGSDAPH